MLTVQEPETDFTFAMGADTFMDLTEWKWRRSRDVLRLLGGRIVAFDRMGTVGDGVTSLRDRVATMNAPQGDATHHVRILPVTNLTDVSSTMIRAIRTPSALNGLVDPAVATYILNEKLYGFAETTNPTDGEV